MKEIKAIIKAYDEIDRAKVRAALATVVRVEGSSYRRAGARMLIMDDGNWIGGISGGCLEGDALIKARSSILRSEATCVTYDTTEDDPYQIGVGLGCNGIIDVLITPLDTNDANNPVEILRKSVQGNRKTNILLTVTAASGNWKEMKPGKSIFYNSEESLDLIEDEMLKEQLAEKIQETFKNQKSTNEHFELRDKKEISIFVEILFPELHLVLMGHQYDIYPLTRIAKEIGWQVTIVSNPLKINPAVSAISDKILKHDQFNTIDFDDHTAVILMAHDYKTDKLNLKKTLATNCVYIGMLGPKNRAEKIFSEISQEGVSVTEEELQNIYAPAGLDIGALTPEEIALSLVSEIRAVFSKRQGGSLRLRKSTIHERNNA